MDIIYTIHELLTILILSLQSSRAPELYRDLTNRSGDRVDVYEKNRRHIGVRGTWVISGYMLIPT
jgi:hypothetical protein